MQILKLDQPEAWPQTLIQCLESNYAIFCGWETRREGLSDAQISGPEYDRAIYGLEDVLNQFGLVGFHCTRLTEHEIVGIRTAGLALPNADMLCDRIDTLVRAEMLCPEIAEILRAKNQAHEDNRANKLWFCFFPPRIAEQWGIERFFRSWGGEALYNMHEDNDLTGPSLARIGVPCIVAAKVPIRCLSRHGGLAMKIARRYVVSKGVKLREPVDHEDYVVEPLPPADVIDIVTFPSRKFSELSGCDTWNPPIAL